MIRPLTALLDEKYSQDPEGETNPFPNTLVYEYPLNEIIRVCLKLEQLFTSLDHLVKRSQIISTDIHFIIANILNILHLLDRPDLKTKLSKEMSQHLTTLARYEKSPELDQNKFNNLKNKLKILIENLINKNGKIGNRLREIELLNSLRTHIISTGGACSFDTPLYHFLLNNSQIDFHKIIFSWLEEFNEIRIAVNLILNIVRSNIKFEEKNAHHGFYQELLDPSVNLRLIRIFIAKQVAAYPELSIGRHFLSIRFFSPCIEKRAEQFSSNLNFHIAYGTM